MIGSVDPIMRRSVNHSVYTVRLSLNVECVELRIVSAITKSFLTSKELVVVS